MGVANILEDSPLSSPVPPQMTAKQSISSKKSSRIIRFENCIEVGGRHLAFFVLTNVTKLTDLFSAAGKSANRVELSTKKEDACLASPLLLFVVGGKYAAGRQPTLFIVFTKSLTD